MRRKTSILIILPISLVVLLITIGFFRPSEVTAQEIEDPPTSDSNPDDPAVILLPKEDPNRSTGETIMPMTSGGPDRFGYTWNDTQLYWWIDASTIGQVVKTSDGSDLNGDDKVSRPIPIDFAFPFYQNSYSQLYVTTNGLITFVTPTYSFLNREMPFIVEPQNLIAPLWDDLHVPTSQNGKVYYHSNQDRMVIAWHNAARYPNTSDLLTFEVILYKNGNICYLYKTLNGILDDFTVGIENSSGTDGLTYLHNSAGLDTIEGSKKICFIRPPASHRVEMSPIYQGGLIIGGSKNFDLELSNIGDLGPDSYELLVVPSDPSWRVILSTSDGGILPDQDHDGLYETSTIGVGNTLNLIAKFYPPPNADIGANTIVDITAFSQNQPTVKSSVKIHGVVPSPFVQGLVIEDAMSLLMVWAENIFLPVVSTDYTGSTMGVTYLPGDQYLYLWEQNGTYEDGNGNDVNFTDLEFAILNGFGLPAVNPNKITNNQSASTYSNIVIDRFPVAAVTKEGKIGIAWIRDIKNGQTREKISNVYFAIYDMDNMSAPEIGPIKVTPNSSWTGENNVPEYNSARIALANARFVITWSDQRDQSGGEEENIGFASYTITGNRRAFHAKVPGLTSTPGSILFYDPDIIGVSANQVLTDQAFLSFVREDTFTVTYSVGYLVLDSNGNLDENPVLITGIQGKSPAVSQFSADPIILSWLNPNGSLGTQQVTFVTIDPATFTKETGPTELVTPNGLSADLLSVSQDNYGNAVLSWVDTDIEESIYYALVHNNGAVITPPVQICDSNGKTITVSKVGASNAAYVGKNQSLFTFNYEVTK